MYAAFKYAVLLGAKFESWRMEVIVQILKAGDAR